jgi:CheY-like chemotaxis protein
MISLSQQVPFFSDISPKSRHQYLYYLQNRRGTSMKKLAGEPFVILLVEDNDAHAELVFRSMKDHRVANTIYHTTDGQKALDFLFHRGTYTDMSTSPRPNLILLDLHLPKMDGLEVLKAIKEAPHLMQIPIVVLTSSEADAAIADSYDYHANSIVVKPLDFEKFTRLMQDIGGYWLGWNMVPVRDIKKENSGVKDKE